MSPIARPAVLIAALAALAAPARADKYKCDSLDYRGREECRQIIVEHGPLLDPQALARDLGLELLGSLPELDESWFLAPEDQRPKDVLKDVKRWAKDHPEAGIRLWEINKAFVSPECRQQNASILELQAGDDGGYASQPALGLLNALPTDAGRGAGILVAVLDTGVDAGHPALAGAVLEPGIDTFGQGLAAADRGNGIDEDGNGVADDGVGHGTAMAGLVTLLAPGSQLMPVRVLDDECQGTAYHMARGVLDAVNAGARILVLGFGSFEDSLPVAQAIRYAVRQGVFLVAPTGNYEPGRRGSELIQFPARDYPDVAAVVAVDLGRRVPPWGVADKRALLAAPGADLVTTYRSGYARVEGTSFSTAVVGGAAAVALAADPALAPRDLRARLRQTARSVEDVNPRLQKKLGAGLPDIGVLAAGR